MPEERVVRVHLTPERLKPALLADSVAVVIDVLRATTTMIHALAAGCEAVWPVEEVEEARRIAGEMRVGRVLLGGERDGSPLPGFDVGNSPSEYTCSRCKGMTLVLTTTNGTRALVRAAAAARTLIAGFVNYSAVCELLGNEARPVDIVCAGYNGDIALEDALLAGAFVEFLCEHEPVALNDAARLAWDCFEHHGRILDGALEVSDGGSHLRRLGYVDDIRAAACVDRFALVPQVRRDPLRVEIGAVGIVKSHWQK
jgi:2-phosphosulfolactate phosphatase